MKPDKPDTSIASIRRRVMLIFVAQSVIGANLSMRMPDLQLAAGLSDAQLGLALMGAPVGAIFSFAVGARLVETRGTRWILLVTYPVLALSAALATIAPGMALLTLALLVNGAAGSVSNMAINVEADRVEATTGARIMNRCHGAWSVGFFASSFTAGALRSIGVDPTIHLWALFPIFWLSSVALLSPMVESPPRPHAGAGGPVPFAWPTLAVMALVAFGIGAELFEGASRVWSTIYLRDAFDVPVAVESAALPAIIFAMAGARLLADGVIDRFGPRIVAGCALAIAMAGLSIAVLTSNAYAAIFGLALAGLGTSVIYPLMLSSAARLGDRPSSVNVGALTLPVQIALMVSPMLMGLVADASGVRVAFGCLIPLLGLGLVMTRVLR